MTATQFELNGQTVVVESADPHCTLLQWLRASGLTGTKEGCAEGECGACAVAFVSLDAEGRAHYQPVNSCLVPLPDMHGRRIVTVEGVQNDEGALHPVQLAMVDSGGSQCGYCTPGFVMSLFCEYYRPGRDGYDPESISGNLCRCTGYRPIVDVARAMAPAPATDRWIERLGQGVAALSHVAPQSFSHVSSSGVSFARPTSFDALFTLLADKPAAVLMAGGTDLMVHANQRYTRYQSLISLSGIHELQRFEWNDAEIVIGAGLPLSHLEHHLDDPAVKEEKRALRELLPLFSSRLIRNRATIGGSLATASPIGDCAPPLLALEAELILKSRTGDRRVPLSEFFTGYRATVLGQGEVIVSIHLPRPLPRIQRFYKVSKRVLDDISTVAAAFGLDRASDGTVKRLTIAYGGIAPTPLRARGLEALAAGKPWNQQTLKQLVEASVTIGTPMKDHRGSSAYRRAMIGKLLERFHAETTEQAEAAQ